MVRMLLYGLWDHTPEPSSACFKASAIARKFEISSSVGAGIGGGRARPGIQLKSVFEWFEGSRDRADSGRCACLWPLSKSIWLQILTCFDYLVTHKYYLVITWKINFVRFKFWNNWLWRSNLRHCTCLINNFVDHRSWFGQKHCGFLLLRKFESIVHNLLNLIPLFLVTRWHVC